MSNHVCIINANQNILYIVLFAKPDVRLVSVFKSFYADISMCVCFPASRLFITHEK